ncbi:hypothetical protein SI65_00090 [Aspergillus cristatus]|uniref:Uncharacterized protein n=1 Tax=Aspergillus cristatus TaxID=573508 RepID=A0A1E3BNF5_ASPCR|nr:hypothetical protein SI65_00090 [Aspergillus cristatus]
MPLNPLKATAAGWLFIALGHTLNAKDWQTLPQFRQLPRLAYTCGTIGWYQGSLFFIMNALINYTWAENPALLDIPLNRVIAGLMMGIMWVSSGWYAKNGVYVTGAVVAAMGGVQAWSVFC